MVETGLSEMTAIIGNVGFPIAITIYLFLRFEKRLENLEKCLSELTEVIKILEKGLQNK